MVVNVIMKRSPQIGTIGELISLLHELRQLATIQPGYISGKSLLSAYNGASLLVVSRWMSLQHWEEYEKCPERQGLLDRLELLLKEPTRTEVYIESTAVDSANEYGSSDEEIPPGKDSPSQQPAIDWKQPLGVRGIDKRSL